MTEQEWLDCDDPMTLLKGAKFRMYRRKSRLFAVACCRCLGPQLVDERSRHAVDVAERYADQEATEEELATAAEAAHLAHREMFDVLGKVGACIEWAAAFSAHAQPFHAAKNVSWMAATQRTLVTDKFNYSMVPCSVSSRRTFAVVLGKWQVERIPQLEPTGADKPVQVGLARCVFGNPFRPVAFDPSWRSSTALSLACSMYASRDFTTAPILADALQDSGCDDPAILEH